MMARSHAISGLAAGFAAAPLLSITNLSQLAQFVLVTAGFAILPDIDHPGSTITRSLGPITRLVSAGLRKCSAALYQITKGPRDENCGGTHRHLTHTILFALVTGGSAAWLGALTSWFVAAVMLAGIGLLNLAVGSWSRKLARLATHLARRRNTKNALRWTVMNWPLVLGATTVAVWIAENQFNPAAIHAELAAMSWRIGVAVALGCLTHCLGDALTLSGCPFLFPLPIAGETWYELRPPRWLRFRTGGGVETAVAIALLAGTVVMAWIYVTPLVNSHVA